MYLSMIPIHRSIYQFIWISLHSPADLSIYLSIYLFNILNFLSIIRHVSLSAMPYPNILRHNYQLLQKFPRVLCTEHDLNCLSTFSLHHGVSHACCTFHKSSPQTYYVLSRPFAGWEANCCNSKIRENEILNNIEQSSKTLSKALIVIVKCQDDFLICIASNYCKKTILQIAARQVVVSHWRITLGSIVCKIPTIKLRANTEEKKKPESILTM